MVTWKQKVGAPQIVAATLLALFLAQCAFFISHVPMTQVEANYVLRGVFALKQIDSAPDAYRSPLVAGAAVLGLIPFAHQSQVTDQFWLDQHRWLVRLPFLAAGLLLGASLWFVARRLFGNNAGYIALGIYCFSPGIIARSSLAGPEILGAWGAFGVVFTAIATAHTLYAPREVVLWNWKRIVLLGISIAIAVGSQWALAVVLVPAALFMFWAVPERRSAAAAIFLAACLVALILFDVIYLGSPRAFAAGIAHAKVFGFSLSQLARPQMYKLLGAFYADASAAASLTALVALGVFVAWRRARFFGNAAPLIVSALLIVCGFVLPESAGATFFFYALPFLILFASGVFADLLESKSPGLAAGIAYGAILAQAVYSVVGLMRVFSRGA
jgi:hypothetical protein